MFLWHMMTILRRCPSTNQVLFFPLPFCHHSMGLGLSNLYLTPCLCLTRSGEWGDHVTLQAAADKVRKISLQ